MGLRVWSHSSRPNPVGSEPRAVTSCDGVSFRVSVARCGGLRTGRVSALPTRRASSVGGAVLHAVRAGCQDGGIPLVDGDVAVLIDLETQYGRVETARRHGRQSRCRQALGRARPPPNDVTPLCLSRGGSRQSGGRPGQRAEWQVALQSRGPRNGTERAADHPGGARRKRRRPAEMAVLVEGGMPRVFRTVPFSVFSRC